MWALPESTGKYFASGLTNSSFQTAWSYGKLFAKLSLQKWDQNWKIGTKDSCPSFLCSNILFYSFIINDFRILAGRFGVTNDILNGAFLTFSGECTQPWLIHWRSTALLFQWQLRMHGSFGTGHIIFQIDVSILLQYRLYSDHIKCF